MRHPLSLILWAMMCMLLWGIGVRAQPSGGTMHTLAINESTSGDRTIVAGVSGQRVRVYRFELYCNAANNVTVKDSAGNVLRAQQNYAAGAGVIRDLNPTLPWFTTASGAGFLLNLSASQQCTGEISYTQGAP